MKKKFDKKHLYLLLIILGVVLAISVACVICIVLGDGGDIDEEPTDDVIPVEDEISAQYYSLSMEEKEISLELLSSPYMLTCITKCHGVTVDRELEWISSNTDVVAVDGGLVTPIGEGIATVTAAYRGQKVECQVTVTFNKLPSLVIEDELVGFILNTTEPYRISPYVYYDGVKYYGEDAGVTYQLSSGGEAIASVSEDGIITPVGYGDTVLTVNADYKGYKLTGQIDISVKYNIETSISRNGTGEVYVQAIEHDGQSYSNTCSFEGSVSQMTAGGMQTLNAPDITWKTSDASVATISADGRLTSVSGGEVYVWFEYVHEGVAHCSERVKVKVLPYLLVDKSDEISIVVNKTTMEAPDAEEIFGEGEILSGVYNEFGTVNVLNGSRLELTGFEYGTTELIFANSRGLAYKVEAALVSEVLEVDGTKLGFYTLVGDGEYELYVKLPPLQEIEKLIADGYNTIDLTANYSAGEGSKTAVNSKYASELSTEVSANQNTTLRFALADLISRYADLSAKKDSYIIKAACGQGESISFGSFTLSKDAYDYDIRLDRDSSLKASSSAKISRLDVIDGVQSQIAFTATASSTESTYKLSVKDLLESGKLGSLIASGYKTVCITYYLEYDSENTSGEFKLLDVNGSTIEKVEANTWATVEIDARSCMLKSEILRLMLDTADADEAVDFKLYIASATLEEDADRPYTVYGSSTYYYATNTDWTYSDAQSKDIEYNVEIGGKTAIIYDSIELGEIGTKSVIEGLISPYWNIGITKEEIKALIDGGYTYLQVGFYADWTSESASANVTVSTAKDSSLKNFELLKGEWNDLKIDLQYYYDNFDFVNSTGHGGWLKVKHAAGITEYTFAISGITAVKE